MAGMVVIISHSCVLLPEAWNMRLAARSGIPWWLMSQTHCCCTRVSPLKGMNIMRSILYRKQIPLPQNIIIADESSLFLFLSICKPCLARNFVASFRSVPHLHYVLLWKLQKAKSHKLLMVPDLTTRNLPQRAMGWSCSCVWHTSWPVGIRGTVYCWLRRATACSLDSSSSNGQRMGHHAQMAALNSQLCLSDSTIALPNTMKFFWICNFDFDFYHL